MKSIRYIKQSNLKDCASSCIYNIIRYYKGNINYNSITKRLNITDKGSSIYNIVKTLRYYKLDSDAYNCDYNSLCKLKYPVIGYFKIKDYYHYVIIKKIKNDKIYIFDPIRGDIIYNKENFLKEWQSIIINIECNNKLNKEMNSYKKYLLQIINENKLLLFIIFIITILFTLSNLSSTYIIKYIIDEFDFKKIIIYLTIFEVLKNILSFINGKLMLKSYVEINSKIRNNIYQKIFNLPNTKEAKTFNLIYRIDDLSYISDFIFNFPGLLIDLLYIIIIFIYFIYKGLLYPYMIILFTILSIVFHLLNRNKIINLFDKERNNYLKLNNNLIEKINLIPIINKLKVSQKFINIESNNYKDYLLSQKKLNNNMLYYSLLINIISLFVSFLIILISFYYNSSNIISLGDFYINYSLFIMYTSSVQTILNYDKLFLSSKNAFKRLVDLYDYVFNGEENNNYIINKSTFIYDIDNKFNENMINNKDMIIINNNEPLLSDSINKNIIFERDISKYELDKVKKVCLINNDNVMASNKEKIILARNLLSNKNTIILNNCTNNIDPITERKIIKNIITEYNKNIILISNRKDNMDLFKYFARIKGGKCEKVKYI